jgi:hypothetical protein
MTGAALASTIASVRSGLVEQLATVQGLRGLHKAPLWASLFPPASWYVIGKSLSLETQLYLGREEAENRLTSYLAQLDQWDRKARTAPDADFDERPVMALIGEATELQPLVNQLVAETASGQAQVNADLARVGDLPTAPLAILSGASFLAKWGAWLVLAVVAVVLYYAWRAGGLKAGARKAVAKAADVVS